MLVVKAGSTFLASLPLLPLLSLTRNSDLTADAFSVKKPKIVDEVLYWRNVTDPLVCTFCTGDEKMKSIAFTEQSNPNGSLLPSMDLSSPPLHHKQELGQLDGLRFVVRGNPKPLVRHRTARNFMYNPSAKAQQAFCEVVEEMVISSSLFDPVILDDSDDDEQPPTSPPPLFASPDQALAMTLVFRMKRAKSHFVNSNPSSFRLRKSAPATLAITRCDVDNLAKFVLDSLQGLLYKDDKQICNLAVTKVYDDQDDCQGGTEVCIRRLKEDNLSTLINNSFQLF